MSDHGWVIKRADGRVAKCGGPTICTACQTEQKVLDALMFYADVDVYYTGEIEGEFGRKALAALEALGIDTEPLKTTKI